MEQQAEILLVEDNMADAELTIRTLRKVHLANQLLHLKDGAEALDYLFGPVVHQLPKLILLDIKMPKVNGMEVLRQIKSTERTRLIPVVIMTSSNEDQDILASYQLGVNSYVVKPVGFAEFAKAVADLGLYWMLVNQQVKEG